MMQQSKQKFSQTFLNGLEMQELESRRQFSDEKFAELRQSLDSTEGILSGKACVYATGSYGRREASAYSDLDLFIVGLKNGKPNKSGIEESALRNLDAICVKADLIEATLKCKIKEFDGDGKYLSHFSVDKLAKSLGKPEDDAENTFTARVLLLLESKPMLNIKTYQDVISDILAAYWRDYKDHKTNFVPAFLTNDILRLWRTFCINYEARTLREPDEEKAKGKLKNYKLKHGRILTCYSALLYLLAVYRLRETVSPADAKEMVGITPTERLQWLLEQKQLNSAHRTIEELLEHYNRFLLNTNYDEKEMILRFQDPKLSKDYIDASHKFGETMFQALSAIGAGNRLHRLIVV